MLDPESPRRTLASRLVEIQDEERRRIARELHDSTGQILAALSMNLSRMQDFDGLDSKVRLLLGESSELVEECAKSTRSLSYLLHPPLLDELGLLFALREYAHGFARRSDIEVEVDLPSGRVRLRPELERALFRVAQEGLSNVYRHSRSKTAVVRIAFQKGDVRLEVVDHGRGMRPNAEAEGSVGIRGMRERMELVGGRLEIESKKGRTAVAATAPLLEAVRVVRPVPPTEPTALRRRARPESRSSPLDPPKSLATRRAKPPTASS